MNAWVLSLILCSATPAPDGSYCIAKPLAFGLSREACREELAKWKGHQSRPRLECINDPDLAQR